LQKSFNFADSFPNKKSDSFRQFTNSFINLSIYLLSKSSSSYTKKCKYRKDQQKR